MESDSLTSLDVCLRRKRMIKRALLENKSQIDLVYLDRDASPTVISTAHALEKELSRIMVNYESLMLRGLDLCKDAAEEGEVYRDDSEFRKTYFECSAKIQEMLSKPPPSGSIDCLNATFSANENIQIKLPKINLKKFSGNIIDFPSFLDLFTNLVHRDTNLSNVQKLYYLKDALTDEAYDLIKDFDITDANYAHAFGLLKNRYENRRLIIMEHFKYLFEQNSINSESGLRGLIYITSKAYRSLQALGEPSVESLLCYIVSSKLDKETRKIFELSINSNKTYPTFKQLMSFLNTRAAVVETLKIANPTHSPVATRVGKYNNHFKGNHVKSFATVENSCPFCKGTHLIQNCKKFTNKSPVERFNVVKGLKLCIGCLNPNHYVSKCTQVKCNECDRRHHSLLHRKNNSNESVGEPTTNNGLCLKSSMTESEVILPTAIVYASSKYRQKILVRLLSDSASQVNLISEGLVKKLKLATFPKHSPVMGIGGQISCARACNLTISSRFNNFTLEIEALIIPVIVTSYNVQRLSSLAWPSWFKVNFAEDGSYGESSVDILLRAEHYELITKNNSMSFENLPFVRETEFGYVVSGKSSLNINIDSVKNCCLVLEDQLRKFWELEEVPATPNAHFTQEQVECENHFNDTYKRNVDGRFVVRLPFKRDASSLGNNRENAVRLFHRLEHKITGDYIKFMNEYNTLNHMKATCPIKKGTCYYLLHNSVIKPNSTSTRLRVVFNGSSRGPRGISINDILMVGPVIQNDLFTILIRFRRHNIVFTCDIEKMYRQILVDKEDRKFQRIVWRKSVSEELIDYCLNTVTYGLAPASYLSIKCLQKLSETAENAAVKEAVLNDFYIDHLMTGTDCVQEAILLQTAIHNTLQSAGFSLRKYMSNSSALLKSLPMEWCEKMQTTRDLYFEDSVNILGMIWCPISDCFAIAVKLPVVPLILTKRIILSEISRIFDPLGFTAPVIVKVKILLQSLWLKKVSWDEALPSDITDIYLRFWEALPLLENMRVPRQMCNYFDYSSVQLHGFSDASEKAYAAAIYVRCIDKDLNVSVRLLCAKTRVAPLKTISIPRLELCGSLLLSRLLNKITNGLSMSNMEIFAYSDSTVVLAWLSKPSCCWKTFVSNRVSKIIENLPRNLWTHIGTDQNPADLATRGISTKELLDNQLWFSGPSFLHSNVLPSLVNHFDTDEKRSTRLCHLMITELSIVESCSSYNRVINVIGYCLRFIYNLKSKVEDRRRYGVLSVSERQLALYATIRMVQTKYFPAEINSLVNSKLLSKRSKLICLNPFLDENKIIRVGGRIKNSSLSYNAKFPIILPKESNFTECLIRNYHLAYLHAFKDILRTILAQNYWIICGHSLIKNIIRKCITCFRQNCRIMNQQMGELPASRVTISNPFQVCGVDYAGPFITKASATRSKVTFKSYIAVIVCFATKAIHLELVSSLSTDMFFLAFKRFLSRRGKPAHVYSDNGKNFVGAAGKLSEFARFLDDQENSDHINVFFSKEMNNWHFIPPYSPHFGGIWEANVKSIKSILRKIIGETILTFELFYTLLCQIESILNSRPLCVDNSEDVLTPAHFLIGRPLCAVPELDSQFTNANLCDLKLQVQMMVKSFWVRWQNEYLITLQRRSKWHNPVRNVAVGDIVLLIDKSALPSSWSIGRIIQVCPGEDHLVRVVKVKTKYGEYLRPVSKVAVLPISLPSDDADKCIEDVRPRGP